MLIGHKFTVHASFQITIMLQGKLLEKKSDAKPSGSTGPHTHNSSLRYGNEPVEHTKGHQSPSAPACSLARSQARATEEKTGILRARVLSNLVPWFAFDFETQPRTRPPQTCPVVVSTWGALLVGTFRHMHACSLVTGA